MKIKKVPMRKCVGCLESKPKKELIRIVANKEGQLSIDLKGKAEGRGVYLCKNEACLAIAKKKRAIKRSLEIEISEEKLDAIFKELMNL
jgi:predicted RNA-binding protein YlxR (DUF448 family)